MSYHRDRKNLAVVCASSSTGFVMCSECSGAGWIDDRGFPCNGQPFFSCEACPKCKARMELLFVSWDPTTNGYWVYGTFEDYSWAPTRMGAETCAHLIFEQHAERK